MVFYFVDDLISQPTANLVDKFLGFINPKLPNSNVHPFVIPDILFLVTQSSLNYIYSITLAPKFHSPAYTT